MAQVTFKGNPINTAGSLPGVGSAAPDFTVIKTDLTPISLGELKGKKTVLNIFPSIDTPVCANSVRRFNVEASKLANTVVLCISKDLPIKYVYSHGCKIVLRIFRFFFKFDNTKIFICIHDAKLMSFFIRYRQDCN